MLLGLPRAACFSFGGRPLQGNLGTSCDGGQIFDEAGLHALTCPTWYITALVSSVTSRSLSLSTNSSITVGSHARLPNLTFPGRRRVTPEAQVFVLISTSAIRGIQEPITALAARSATFLSRASAQCFRNTPRWNYQGWSLVGHQSTSVGCERASSLGRKEDQTLQLLSSRLLHGAPRRIHPWSSPPRLFAIFLALRTSRSQSPSSI